MGTLPRRSFPSRADFMAKHIQRNRRIHPRPGGPALRKRGLMEELPAPQDIANNLRKARSRRDSVEKVIEISAVALDMSRTGNVALSYNTFGEAVRAVKSLPFHVREDALAHVQAAFRKTEMHMDCYFSLLRTSGTSSRAHARG